MSDGQSTAGFGGHSDSAHWRKLTLPFAASSDHAQAGDEAALHSTFGDVASEDGTAPHASKLHSPLAVSVWRVEPPSVGLLASSLPPHAARNVEPNSKAQAQMMFLIDRPPDTPFPKPPRNEATSIAARLSGAC